MTNWATIKRWRDLRCKNCGTVEGFTTTTKMCDGYRYNYWCETCQDHQDHDLVGVPYARGKNMERMQMTLEESLNNV